jgi:hypothetical protein
MLTNPKYCPVCKNYTDHELVPSCDNCGGRNEKCSPSGAIGLCSIWKQKDQIQGSNSWKCSKCGAVDQYKDSPSKKENKHPSRKKEKCDCGGLLVPHPDGSGLLQCEKCKASVFIMTPEKPPVESELTDWTRMPGPGVNKPASRQDMKDGKVGDEKSTNNCPKCGTNSWTSEFDNGIEMFTCKTKGCNFKSFSPCKDIQPWGNVQLCKHTHSSCNGTRLENKCPRKSKKITKNINFKGKTVKAKGKITASPEVVNKLENALQSADGLSAKQENPIKPVPQKKPEKRQTTLF